MTINQGLIDDRIQKRTFRSKKMIGNFFDKRNEFDCVALSIKLHIRFISVRDLQRNNSYVRLSLCIFSLVKSSSFPKSICFKISIFDGERFSNEISRSKLSPHESETVLSEVTLDSDCVRLPDICIMKPCTVPVYDV
ncbi:hypothetical protein KSF78_0003658 [Schistosoma japonicum]|nr:hypothetical protein KSF78_0003658 [Schistosoma japonicum]